MTDPIPSTRPAEHPEPSLSPHPTLSPPAPIALHWIFAGPGGIRAGWRLLMFFTIAAFFLLVLDPLRGLLHGYPAAQEASGNGVVFLALLLSTVVMSRVEKRPFSDYALPGRGAFGIRFWQGVAWGFVALTALLMVICAAHSFSFGRLALGGADIAYYGARLGVDFLMTGLLEEFLFRGYALYTMTTVIGFWPSAVLLSALFGMSHLYNRGENWTGALAAGLIGLFFCFTVRRTGDLWFAIGLHAAWDYSESFIYSVPDSGIVVSGHLLNSSFHGPRWLTGGTVGPEGSALVFVVIAAMFVVFDRLYRDVKFPPAAKRTASM